MEQPKKHRITRQRQLILEQLRSVTSHPTADEIYQMVRAKLPNISLGTIYRNLEILAKAGAIQKVDLDDNRLRYDGNPKAHYHIKCTECGRVGDLHNVPEPQINTDDSSDWMVVGHRLDFFGICPECTV